MLKKAGFEMAAGSSQDVHMMIFFFPSQKLRYRPTVGFLSKGLNRQGKQKQQRERLGLRNPVFSF